MKQFQITYENDKSFCDELEKINRWCDTNPSYTVLFRIYSDDMNLDHIKHVCNILDEKMPDALYFGCTTHANILEGKLAKDKIVLSCTVFEYETTQVKLLQLPFSEENAKEVVGKLREYCNANTWVSAVETHVTMLGMSVREFCDELSTLRSDIQVFGGVACSPAINDTATTVFSKGNNFSVNGIVFLLLGGVDFHVYSTYISGWKPLRRKFKVTKTRGEVICELDGEPAFNIYRRFLNIEKNDELVFNTLEFPFLMDYNGIDVLRCLLTVYDDDSIAMTCEVEEGSDVRLAYGDPEMILSSIRVDGQKVTDFQPEVIQTFSCAARRSFWGDENISDETVHFNKVAPTSGFYTGGELLRIDGDVRTFNITLVLAAMREGEPKNIKTVNLSDAKLVNTESSRITLIRRFISFIEASTADFEELNRKLAITSITDGLTGLYNRTEIERRIRSTVEDRSQDETCGDLSLIMIDIDQFKRINDVYGHKEGDRVIIGLADVLRNVLSGAKASDAGRWGGEEFMVLLPDSNINEAMELAEKIRTEFAAAATEVSGHQTVSIGVVQAKRSDDADTLYTRVDEALYTAKTNGKDQVIKQD